MNKILCLECNKILESKHRHDFVGCGCPNGTFVDGGDVYCRTGGKDLSKIAYIREDRIMAAIRYGKVENKRLIIMKGIPGGGKSTLAHNLIKEYGDGIVLSTDDYFMTPEGYIWSREKMGAAHRWNQNRCRLRLREGIPVIVVDNTNLVAKEIKPYIEAVKDLKDYSVIVVEPYNEHCRNPQVLFERNQHGVPMETILAMLKREEPLGIFCSKLRGYLNEENRIKTS